MLSPDEVRFQRPRYCPADAEHNESWWVANPNGIAIHFESAELAKGTALMWADEMGSR